MRTVRRVGMACAVVQRFLNHAIDAGLVFVGKIVGIEFGRDAHVHRRALGGLAGLPFQGRNQPQIVQHRGPQQKRHIANHADRALHQALDGFHVAARLFVGADRQPRRKIAQFHQHGRKRLAHFVVQFARERAALGLLRLNQARGEILELAAGLGDFLIAQAGLILQLQNLRSAEQWPCPSPAPARPPASPAGASGNAAAAKPPGRSRRQLLFVDGGDAVGDGEHVLPARENLVAQKSVPGAASFAAGPIERSEPEFPSSP